MTAPTRLRQVVLAAREIEGVSSELENALGVRDGFNDPGVGAFGLKNVVYAAGVSFVEVVIPTQDDTAAGRTIDKHGEGGYMVIFQVGDIEAARTRVADLGIRIVWHAELDDIDAMHLHPKDIGGAIVSIDEPRPYDSWRWGGPSWIGDNPPVQPGGVTAITVRVPDAEAMAAKWSAVLGEPAEANAIALDEGRQRITFAELQEGEREGLSEITIATSAAPPKTVFIGGATFTVVAP